MKAAILGLLWFGALTLGGQVVDEGNAGSQSTDSPYRVTRSAMFNLPGPGRTLDENDSINVAGGIHVSLVSMPELPVSEADTICVAKLVSVQPFVSADRRNLYSEYTFLVEKVLKRTDGNQIASQIQVVRAGFSFGMVRLQSGRLVSRPFTGYGADYAIGTRYLMFLEYVEKAACFRGWKSWELRDGSCHPMAMDDSARHSNGLSKVAMQPERLVIDEIKTLVKAQGGTK